VILLGQRYQFGSADLAAPQATLMKTVIEGVLAGSLPWNLVGTGAGLAIGAIIAGLPGLSFAIGLYLPLATLSPIFVGGSVRRMVEARRGDKANPSDFGILAASGMIAGEGLAGVAIAFFGALAGAAKTALLTGAPGKILGVAVVLAVCTLLYRAGRSAA